VGSRIAAAIWGLIGRVHRRRVPLDGFGVASWYDFAVAIQDEALARGLLSRAVPISPILSAAYPRGRAVRVQRARHRIHAALVKVPARHWQHNLRTMLDDLRPRNVFVTGGAGSSAPTSCTTGWRTPERAVVVFDALTYAGNIDNLAGLDADPRYVFVKGDICDEPRCARCSNSITSTRWRILRRNRMSIGRSWVRTTHTHQYRRHPLVLKAAKTLWIDRKTSRRTAFITCRPMKCMAPWGRRMRLSMSHSLCAELPYSASKASSDIWCVPT